MARQPADDEIRLVVAQSQVRLGRGKDALKTLEEIPAERRDAEVDYALGRVQALLGDAAAARTHLMAANALEPHRHGILAALLDLDMREGRLEESAARLSEALAARPDDAKLLQLRGQVLLYLGKTQEAEAAFRKAIEIDPNDLAAYQNLARYLALTHRPEDVLRTYEQALERNPKAAILHLIVGSLYELQGRQEDAMARYESAIEIDPSLAVAKNNLAYLLAERNGNLERALDLAQEAKAALPDNPNAADTLGWVLYRKNVPSAAIGYLREAEGAMTPSDPQVGIVRHHLALAYEANGDPAKARETLERALRDLDRIYSDPKRPEPPWTADLRSMLERLRGST